MKLAPVLLFVYNRPWHTKMTIDALRINNEAKETDLHIFSDGPKTMSDLESVNEVRTIIANTEGFHSLHVTERHKNLGLAHSIISGVTDILKNRESVIVLEDDIRVGSSFLKYMNNGLIRFASDGRVASVHGWNFPLKDKNLPDTFFLRGADCWGWATWKRAWKEFEPNGQKLLMQLESQNLLDKFDLDGAYPYTQMLRDQIAGKNNSWAIRWHASMFIKDKFTLHPSKSLVQNIGLDGSGVHSGQAKAYETQISQQREWQFPTEVIEDDMMRKKIIAYLKKNSKPRFMTRLKSKIKGWVSRPTGT